MPERREPEAAAVYDTIGQQGSLRHPQSAETRKIPHISEHFAAFLLDIRCNS